MKLKLVLMTIALIVSGNWSVFAREIPNQFQEETTHHINQTTGQCPSDDCCDDNCGE